MPPLEAVKALVSIMMSGSWLNKGKLLKLRHNDISRAHFQETSQRLKNVRLVAEDRQKHGEGEVCTWIKSMYGTQDASHIWQLHSVNLIFGEVEGFRRCSHSAALCYNTKEDVRMAVRGGDFFLPDDGLKHVEP